MSKSADGWVKSTYSDGGANCVETRRRDDVVQFRDSKRGESGPAVSMCGPGWSAFVAGLQHDRA
ncbi:DUF397 domain-containing protein [Streptomyces sp. NPDC002454]